MNQSNAMPAVRRGGLAVVLASVLLSACVETAPISATDTYACAFDEAVTTTGRTISSSLTARIAGGAAATISLSTGDSYMGRRTTDGSGAISVTFSTASSVEAIAIMPDGTADWVIDYTRQPDRELVARYIGRCERPS